MFRCADLWGLGQVKTIRKVTTTGGQCTPHIAYKGSMSKKP